MAILLKTDGTYDPYPEPANGKEYIAQELNAAVGGYFQIVYLSDGRLMLINEDAKQRGMGVNLLATSMTRDILAASDLIVGDALVIERHAPFSRGTPELMSTLVEIPSSPCFI